VNLRIHRDPRTDTYDFYITDTVDGDVYMVRMVSDGQWERVATSRGQHVEPSFSFPAVQANELMRDLAAELAQLGFTQFDAAPSVKAHQRHIEDLQLSNSRLFTLAEKVLSKA
jgi:hypothetical protein